MKTTQKPDLTPPNTVPSLDSKQEKRKKQKDLKSLARAPPKGSPEIGKKRKRGKREHMESLESLVSHLERSLPRVEDNERTRKGERIEKGLITPAKLLRWESNKKRTTEVGICLKSLV